MSTLALAFKANDSKKNGMFDFGEVEAILAKGGLFLKRQELTKLFRHFDAAQNEQINYREFLRAIQVTDVCIAEKRNQRAQEQGGRQSHVQRLMLFCFFDRVKLLLVV